jgi:Asp-tRNA(Asn)/Glu-tRNA(Gln) amidotransferase B subunit
MEHWEVVIGLETHAQLATQSKIFSGAATAFGAAPNVQACAVDIALPGVLPVLNRSAVACAIRFGLAVEARIAPRSVFARKNYFYPDLPKGYQISQYDEPLCEAGHKNRSPAGTCTGMDIPPNVPKSPAIPNSCIKRRSEIDGPMFSSDGTTLATSA